MSYYIKISKIFTYDVTNYCYHIGISNTILWYHLVSDCKIQKKKMIQSSTMIEQQQISLTALRGRCGSKKKKKNQTAKSRLWRGYKLANKTTGLLENNKYLFFTVSAPPRSGSIRVFSISDPGPLSCPCSCEIKALLPSSISFATTQPGGTAVSSWDVPAVAACSVWTAGFTRYVAWLVLTLDCGF